MGNTLVASGASQIEKDLLRQALLNALPSADALVAEHIEWALNT